MILETRHLQLVAAVAEHGTLTRASRDLNLTQSALSHQLVNLETRLGAALFNRLGKRMTLTAAGSRLLVAAQRTLGELRTAEEELQQVASGKVASLRICTECYTTYHWLPRVMRAFAASHPGVDLQVVADATEDPLAALLDGRVDLAVMMNPHAGKHARAYPLFDDEMVAVVCPDHVMASRAFVDLDALATEHIFSYSAMTEPGSFTGSLLRDAGVTPRRTSTVQLTEAIIELVEAGLGISVLARWAAAPYAARGQVALVRLTRAGVHRRWHAVALRQSAVAEQVKQFVALLKRGPLVLETPAVHAAHVLRPALRVSTGRR